jgi:UDP-N-acetylmuramate dehydrogenase
MIKIQRNFCLDRYNTFRISVMAENFIEVHSIDDIEKLMQSVIFKTNSHFILGGGSNILFTKDYEGLVIHPSITGIESVEVYDEYEYFRVGSGVVWDDFVAYAVEKDRSGIENLSGIPGMVGASPIQNIGAYGKEVKDVITKVEGFDLGAGTFKSYSNEECRFGYRTSLFKETMRNEFLVCYVTFRLKKPPHILDASYGTLEQELLKYPDRNISTVRLAVRSIRNLKLPDPQKIGNAGSFFKNPVIQRNAAEKLRKQHPSLPLYPAGDETMKLSAAWLIDEAGCKGLHLGKAATHRDQPLVLINLGGAKGNEILKLSHYIQDKVDKLFGIRLEEEVNVV